MTLILCVSPDAAQLSETLSTLRFGSRCVRVGPQQHKAACRQSNPWRAQSDGSG